jgi:ribosome-associated protein
MTEPIQKTHQTTREQVQIALRAIEDKKGSAIRVLDVRGKSSITDYLILATGSSNPHLKAMKTGLDEAFKNAGVQLIGANREVDSGWLVVDAFDFMVHLQTEELRATYQLDQLWGDAADVQFAD